MSEKGFLLDDLINMFQSSLEQASKRLQNEEKGDLRYTVTNLNVELSAAVQGDIEERQPRLRLPSFTELAKGESADLSRISFGLSPVPFPTKKTEQVISSSSLPPARQVLINLLDKLKDKDTETVLKAIKELQSLDEILQSIITELKKLKNNPNREVQKNAEKIIKSIKNLD